MTMWFMSYLCRLRFRIPGPAEVPRATSSSSRCADAARGSRERRLAGTQQRPSSVLVAAATAAAPVVNDAVAASCLRASSRSWINYTPKHDDPGALYI